MATQAVAGMATATEGHPDVAPLLVDAGASATIAPVARDEAEAGAATIVPPHTDETSSAGDGPTPPEPDGGWQQPGMWITRTRAGREMTKLRENFARANKPAAAAAAVLV